MVKENVLSLKVIREIKNNFRQYLSVILIAALAVTLFTGILANYENFKQRLDEIYSKTNTCDGAVLLKSSDTDVENFISDKVSYYEKRIFISAKAEGRNVYAATFTQSSKMNLPYSSSDSVDENYVYIDSRFSSETSLKKGDTLYIEELSVAENSPLYGVKLPFTVGGTIVHPESLANSSYSQSFIYVGEKALISVVTSTLNEKISPLSLSERAVGNYLRENYLNEYLFKCDDAEKLTEEIRNEFKGKDNFVFSLTRQNLPTCIMVEADIEQSKNLIYVFPVIFYFVATLIILTSISQLINRDGKNIGILKAFGYSTAEITLHYSEIFLALSLIGSAIGIIAGPLIIPRVMSAKYNILYQLPTINHPFFRPEYLFSAGLLFLISMITCSIVSVGTAKKMPVKTLRGENSVNFKPSPLEKGLLFRKLSLSVKMALRNMRRKFSRTVMVFIGTLGCSALLLCGFGIEDTLLYGINHELDDITPYDVSVVYTENGSKGDALSSLDGIDKIDEFSQLTVNLNGGEKTISSYVYVFDDERNIFTPELKKDGCVISSKVAKDLGVKKGDKVSFVFDAKTYSAEITEITDFCLTMGLVITKSRFSELPFSPNRAYISVSRGFTATEIKEDILALDGVTSAKTRAEQAELIDSLLGTIKIMTRTIKVFAILLAVVVLYNLALLNYNERIRDIATLKVLGFGKFEIISSFVIEIVFLTLLGSLTGLIFGYPLTYAVMSINENPLICYIYHIFPSSFMQTVALTCGSSLVINLFFGFLTDRIKPVESLKSVE